jgi:transcriptional regulator with XRE-family HTH domain
MEEPKDRLKSARVAAGFKTSGAAADAISDIHKNTIASNENGNRPISRKMAEVYAKAFQQTPSFFLFAEDDSAKNVASELDHDALKQAILRYDDKILSNAIVLGIDEQVIVLAGYYKNAMNEKLE